MQKPIQQERANQLAAAGKMQDAYSQGIQNQTTALSDLGQEYTQERARQIQGLMSATGLADEDYKNILALGDVGAQKEGYDQAQIDAAMQKWNWEQQEPMAWLGEYANLISGGYGGTTTATNPGYYNYAKKSQLGSILGGAGSGAMAGSAAGPYGMAAGAVIGAGLGAMQ